MSDPLRERAEKLRHFLTVHGYIKAVDRSEPTVDAEVAASYRELIEEAAQIADQEIAIRGYGWGSAIRKHFGLEEKG